MIQSYHDNAIWDMPLEDRIPLVVEEAISREEQFNWDEILKENYYSDDWDLAGQILEPLMTEEDQDADQFLSLVQRYIEQPNWVRMAEKIHREGY